MATSINKVILIGNLGKDPEMKFTSTGKITCKFSLATNARWTDNGEKKEAVTWHNIETWGRLAEICNKYLHKGSQVYVEGRIDNRSWDDQGIKKYYSSVVAEKVRFLDSKGEVAVDQQPEGADQAQEMPSEYNISF